jgi:glycosyltransferase involved in cell wall biosynthesis
VITGLETGGAEMMLAKLVGAWAKGGPSSAVISLRDGGTLETLLRQTGTTVDAVGIRGAIPGAGSALRLRRQLRATRPDLVQGWMYHGNLGATWATAMTHRAPPVVWNIRHSVYDLRNEKRITSAMIRVGALISGSPAAIIYNSRTSAAQHAALGYSARRAVVIPNGFDTMRFRPDAQARRRWRAQLGIPGDVPLVGLVARWHPMKDHATFLDAAARVLIAQPTAHFALAGRGVEATNPELASLLQRTGLQNRLRCVGEIEDVPGFLSSLDVAVSSSYSEAFANVLGEALAAGVPVVATDVGDSRWIVGDAGLVVPPRDAEALSNAISRVLDRQPVERTRLGEIGRARVIEEFALERIADRYRALYDDVLKEWNGAARGG